MSKIIDRNASTVLEFQRVDTARLGAVILVDDIRPAADPDGEQRRDNDGTPIWIGSLQVPGMRTRDADGMFTEIALRLAAHQPPRIDAPAFIELGDATVSASNARTDGGTRAYMRISTSRIRQTERPPNGDAVDGIPIIIPGAVRWMGASPAKGYGGTPRIDNGQPVYLAQLLVDEEGVRRDTGERFTTRKPFTVELVGDSGRDLRPLELVTLTNPGVQLSIDDFGRRARLTATASAVTRQAPPVVPPVPKVKPEPKADEAAA